MTAPCACCGRDWPNRPNCRTDLGPNPLLLLGRAPLGPDRSVAPRPQLRGDPVRRGENDPLMPLAEYLAQWQAEYSSGEFLSPRELGIVKWATLYALLSAVDDGWRFEHGV